MNMMTVDANANTKALQSQISVTDLSVKYNDYYALKNVTGCFKPVSMTAIVGPNGGGKSTFLKTLVKLQPNYSGKIDYHHLGYQDMAYVPQLSEIDRGFPLIVEEAVAFGLCQKFGFFKSIPPAAQQQIHDALNDVGLYGLRHKTLDTLSGGQFQRVLFARLSVQTSKFIFLDEPFAAVDNHTVKELIQIILKWHQMGKSIVMVSHDFDLVRHYFDQAILIAQQCIGWGPVATVINNENILKANQISRDFNNPLIQQSAPFSALHV